MRGWGPGISYRKARHCSYLTLLLFGAQTSVMIKHTQRIICELEFLNYGRMENNQKSLKWKYIGFAIQSPNLVINPIHVCFKWNDIVREGHLLLLNMWNVAAHFWHQFI